MSISGAALLRESRYDLSKVGESDRERRLKQLRGDLHPKQVQLFDDPHRRIAVLSARGSGKTTTLKARYFRRMDWTPKARCLYIATTRDQAIDLMWNPIKDLCERLSMPAKFHETALRCTFLENDSQLKLVGADDKRQIEKYRGIPFHEVWIDESASFDHKLLEHLIERVIGPRLGDFGGMLGMIGTPGHILKGPFYEATFNGSPDHFRYEDRETSTSGYWSFHSWTAEDGAPHVATIAKIWEEALTEKREKQWSDQHPVWLREYRATWAADDTDSVFKYRPHNEEGAEWNQWDPERDARGIAKLPDGIGEWSYSLGLDYGSRDPTAIGVYAYSANDPQRRLFHVYEFEKRGMYLRTIAELLIGEELDAANPRGLIGAIGGWPDSMVADADQGFIDELSAVYGISFKKADRKQETRFSAIELANGDLIDGRVKILKGSRLEEQLVSLQWARDEFGIKKKDKSKRDDQADQFIYARMAANHLISSPAPEQKPFFPPRRDPINDPPEREEDEMMLSDEEYQEPEWWE